MVSPCPEIAMLFVATQRRETGAAAFAQVCRAFEVLKPGPAAASFKIFRLPFYRVT
jgi:hypothetical protein